MIDATATACVYDSRTTVRTENTIRPAQGANRFKAFGIIDEILDIDHGEKPDWKARKKGAQHQDKPVGLPFQDNSPESIMSPSLLAVRARSVNVVRR